MSDDDVSRAATSGDDDSDGDTTAAAVGKRLPRPLDDEEEDRTVQQKFDQAGGRAPRSHRAGSPVNAPRPFASAAPTPPATPAALSPMRMTSKKPTAVGLGAPPLVTRPAAGFDPTPPTGGPAPSSRGPSKNVPDKKRIPTPVPVLEADAADDSITATAPAPGASLPITLPGKVKITEIGEDEPLDETEVRTLVAVPGQDEPRSSPAPAAGAPPSPGRGAASEADEPDDSVTTQAPSPIGLITHDDDLKTSPPRLAPQPMPAAGRRPSDSFAAAKSEPLPIPTDDYGEESVTTRGPAVDYEDDSVTAQAPVAVAPEPIAPGAPRGPGAGAPPALKMPPALDDRSRRSSAVPRPLDDQPRGGAAPGRRSPGSSPDIGGVHGRAPDRDAPSITSEAPAGHLSNMLHIIGVPDDHAIDDRQENHTAVMVNAPVKPPGAFGRGGQAAALAVPALGKPSSDSGLRVARADGPPVEHANLDMVMAVGPMGGVHESGRGRPPNPFAKTEMAFDAICPGPNPNARTGPNEVDFASTIKKPRYGLLVAAVALLSFAIPLLLFVLLQAGSEPAPREKSELVPDRSPRVDPKIGKAAAPPKASAAPSATPSPPPRRNDWFPRRR